MKWLQSAPAGYQHLPLPINGVPVPPSLSMPQNGGLPPLPLGVDLPPGLTCPDAISRTLNTLPPAQLLDVLSQMKSLVTTDQTKAVELLRQAPQLAYAIFQALLLMGLVSTEALGSVVEQATATPAPVPPIPTVQAPTPQVQTQYPPPPIPIPGQGFPPGFPPPPPQMVGQVGTPPIHNMPYPPPPQYQAPRSQPAAAPAPATTDTDALIQQVLTMPQEVIDSLPPAERAQLLALRASFMPR